MKKLSILLILVVMLSVVTGCDLGEESTVTTTELTETELTPIETNENLETTVTPENTEVPETSEALHIHSWSDWITTLEATCTEEGKQERSCSCGEKETLTISALGHAEVIDEAIVATCDKEGKTEGRHCWVCNTVIAKQEVIPVLDHNYVNRICSVCGCVDGSKGLEYFLSLDRTHYSVTGLGTCTDEDIYIPSSYKGVPVTDIYAYSFYKATQIKNIYLPNTITSIGDNAFAWNENLKSINIPDSVTSIGAYAFYGCTNLTSITIPDSVTTINNATFFHCKSLTNLAIGGSVTNIGVSAFNDCISLTNINIPKSVTSIGYMAFANCSNLALAFINNPECDLDSGVFPGLTVIISDSKEQYYNDGLFYRIFISFNEYSSWCNDLAFQLSNDGTSYVVTGIGECKSSHVVIPCLYNNLPVEAIGDRAFYNCTELTEITIPYTITSIGEQIFYKADNLHTVYYNAGYRSHDYSFINIANITKIVYNSRDIWGGAFRNFTNIKEFIIGDFVEGIGVHAFDGCTSLTDLTIGNGVTRIFNYAFQNCTSLKNVSIGNSVTDIYAGAFSNCKSLTSVTIPDSLTYIDSALFQNCTSLTSLTIPDSVTMIGEYVFSMCTNIKDIYYTGTEAEWNAITIIDEGNSNLTKATIHYNSKQ